MRMGWLAALLLAGGLPAGLGTGMTGANLSGNDQTPRVAAPCQGFGNAAEILRARLVPTTGAGAVCSVATAPAQPRTGRPAPPSRW